MREPSSNPWSVRGPWLLSAAALVVAILGLARGGRPSPEAPAAPSTVSPPSGVSAVDVGALRADVQSLRERVRTLEAAVAASHATAAAPVAPTASQAKTEPQSDAPPAPRKVPPERRIVHFDVPSTAVTATEDEFGAISVHNRDPALTGQMISVQARAADGSTRTLNLVIPPPGS